MEWKGKIGLVPIECIFPLFPYYTLALVSQTPWFLRFVAFFNVVSNFLEIVLEKLIKRNLFGYPT